MGADVLRTVKTFFFFIGERPDLLGNLLKWHLQGRKTVRNDSKTSYCEVCMLWFSFTRGLNFIFLCFKLIIIHYHTQNPHEIKLKQRIKVNHQMYTLMAVYVHFYRFIELMINYHTHPFNIIGFKEVVQGHPTRI